MTRLEIRQALTAEIAVRATLEGECRGEPILGQIAVGCVIRNRVKQGTSLYGMGWVEVCLKPHQFSCWWGTDANSEHVYQTAQVLIEHGPDINAQLEWITKGIIGGMIQDDPTHGATNYLEETLFLTHPPSWAQHPVKTVTIGQHVFLTI